MVEKDKELMGEYVQWVTPKFGDPTYTLIRAHLKFEQLFNQYLDRKLPYSKALEGARFSFSQKVALARALATELEPSDWRWTAVGKLNKLRNLLAHEPHSGVKKEIDQYTEFCVQNSGVPLPGNDLKGVKAAIESRHNVFLAVDLVTAVLYGALEVRLLPPSPARAKEILELAAKSMPGYRGPDVEPNAE